MKELVMRKNDGVYDAGPKQRKERLDYRETQGQHI